MNLALKKEKICFFPGMNPEACKQIAFGKSFFYQKLSGKTKEYLLIGINFTVFCYDTSNIATNSNKYMTYATGTSSKVLQTIKTSLYLSISNLL
jgi:hypothetical protein